MIRVLFIAHYFPPIGGGGVQRSAKFVKYLPRFGIQPIVLTGPGKDQSHWTPEDATLVADVPPSTPVFRAAWGSPSERLQNLMTLGNRIIEEERPAVILVSMSPFADAALATELARRHRLPWIADLRDPWALDEFQVYRTRWHRKLEVRKMRSALRSASRIILNTPEASRRFKVAFPELAGKVGGTLTNGYDSEDYASHATEECHDRFTIVHSGYFHAEFGLRQQRRRWEYNLLGRSEPGVEFLPRSHFYLLRALARWKQQQPEIAHSVRLTSVGKATSVDRQLVEESPVAGMFEFTGYRPHAECVSLVRSADLLFLPLYKVPPGRRSGIVPGKTYEYMASGRPILAALPEGDARDYVVNAGTGLVCEPDDVDGMVRILKEQFAAWKAGRQTVTWNREYVEQFERRRLTERLAEEIARTLNICPGSA